MHCSRWIGCTKKRRNWCIHRTQHIFNCTDFDSFCWSTKFPSSSSSRSRRFAVAFFRISNLMILSLVVIFDIECDEPKSTQTHACALFSRSLRTPFFPSFVTSNYFGFNVLGDLNCLLNCCVCISMRFFSVSFLLFTRNSKWKGHTEN